MADASKLSLLDERLSNIENRIFGQGSVDREIEYPKVVDSLRSIHAQINTAIASRPKIETAFKRIGELNQYLDVNCVDRLTLSTEAKLDLVLSEEESIREQVALLEKISGLVDVLNSEHIRAIPTYEGRLHDLSRLHILQQDEASALGEETSALLSNYNNIITLLSKQFAQWDELVTKLELASRPKPVTD